MKVFLLFICLFSLYSISFTKDDDFAQVSVDKISELISTKPIQVAALGRVADLGDLYDAKTGQFIDVSLYYTDFSGDADAVHATDITYSAVSYVRKETLRDKMKILDIYGGVCVHLLAEEFAGVSGSAKYLEQKKESSKSTMATFKYSIRTVREHLKIFFDTSRKSINTFLLNNIDATHIVVGTEWGADVCVTLEETNTDFSDSYTSGGKLEAGIGFILVSLSADLEIAFEGSDIEDSSTFKLHLHGDIIPDTIPQTINETIAFIRRVPQLIKENNNGKGKIMRYILMDLSTVQKILKPETKLKGVVKDINQGLIDKFTDIYQEMMDSELQIKDVYNDMVKWSLMISKTDFQNLLNLKSQFYICTNDIRKQFKDLVAQYRHGYINDAELVNWIDTYHNSNCSTAKIDQSLKTYTSTMHKIALLNLLERFNALFINSRTDKDKIFAENYDQEIKILSVDLTIDISSPYVREIVRLLQAKSVKVGPGIHENAKKAKFEGYYIEDNPNLTAPNVTVYLEGKIKNTFIVGKKEYIILVSESGKVIIMDANSYFQVDSFVEPNLKDLSFAIVNDILYIIDTETGLINSTGIGNIIAKPKEGIKWIHVGSFRKESCKVRSVAAVQNYILYFITCDGILYKYDTILKTVTKLEELDQGSVANHSLIMVKQILYIYRKEAFYSFNGVKLEVINTTDIRKSPALFEFEGKICQVGGESDSTIQHPVQCFNPSNGEWLKLGNTNEVRRYPAVVKTKSGTIIFGGISVNSTGHETDKLESAEIFNHGNKNWSYISVPPAMVPDVYSAFSYIS